MELAPQAARTTLTTIISRFGMRTMAVGHIKRAVQTGAEVPLEYGLALERELQAKLFASADAQEGLAAFDEKRAPRFGGR